MYDTTNSCVQHDSMLHTWLSHVAFGWESWRVVIKQSYRRACACVCVCVHVCACMCVLLLNLPTHAHAHAHAHALPTLKWLIHPCVWHDPFIHMCDVSFACDLITVSYPRWSIQSRVTHDSFIHTNDMTHSFICVTRLIHTYTPVFWPPLLLKTTQWFICKTCLSKPYVWHDSFTHIHLCFDYIILPEMPPDIFSHSFVGKKKNWLVHLYVWRDTFSHIHLCFDSIILSEMSPDVFSHGLIEKKKLIRLSICVSWLIHTYTPVFWSHYPLQDVPRCLQS